MFDEPLLIKLRYRGRLRDPQQVYALSQEVEDICETHGWSHHRWDEDWSQPSNLKIDFTGAALETEGHAALKGITFHPHPDSESVWLTFEPDGTLHSLLTLNQPDFTADLPADQLPWQRVKTGYDGVETHIQLCNLLRYLADRYFDLFEVNDEAGYWQHGDEARVRQWMAEIDRKRQALRDAIAAVEADDSLSEEDRQQRVMQLIYEHSKHFRRSY